MDRNKINITRAKGMQDVGPELQLERQSVADQVIQCFRSYGYDPIDLPTIEPYELYSGIYGDYTRQQLFTLVGQREYSLRPDMTASVARMINHNLVQGKEENCRGMSRVYYSGKCFRFINPRRYRFREYWQVGGELFGSPEPLAEIELLSFISSLMVKLNIDNYYLLVGDVKLFRTILEKVSPLPYKDTLFRDLIRLGGIIHRLSRADEHYLKSLLQQLTKLRYSLSTMFNDVPKAELSEESYDLSPGDKQEIEALSQWALDLFKYKWNKIFSVSQEDCQLLGQLISIKGDWQEIKSMLLDLQKNVLL